MSPPSPAPDLPPDQVFEAAHVYQSEAETIAERRRRGTGQEWSTTDVSQTLVGVALSGGGLRSAAFSLGVLHRLFRRGVYQWVDYLSTVSGGSFTGAFLSTAAMQRTPSSPGAVVAERTSAVLPSEKPEFVIQELFSSEAGGSSPAMQRLVNSGCFLSGGLNVWKWLNHQAISVFLMWLLVGSGICMGASFIAWCFRHLDYPEVREWVAAFGFGDDVSLAFFPAFVLSLLWVSCWLMNFLGVIPPVTKRLGRFFFCSLCLTILVAIGALLGTGDINLQWLAIAFGWEALPDRMTAFGSYFRMLLFGVTALGLLPYLSPKALFRSGEQPRSSFQRFTFWFSTRVLLVCSAILTISAFAAENISGYHSTRPGAVQTPEVKNWTIWEPAIPPLWQHLYLEPHLQESAPRRPQAALHVQKESDKTTPEPQVDEFAECFYSLIKDDARQRAERAASSPDKKDLAVSEEIIPTFEELERIHLQIQQNELDRDRAPALRSLRWLSLGQLAINRFADWCDSGPHDSRPEHLRAVEESAGFVERAHTLRHRSRLIKEAFLELLNKELASKDFYLHFRTEKGTAKIARPSIALPDQSTRQGHLERLLLQAAVLRRDLINDPESPVAKRRQETIVMTNRRILEAFYGPDCLESIDDPVKVFALVVIDHDQQIRWSWFWMSGVVFCFLLLTFNMNVTSWHTFYSGQLSQYWLAGATTTDHEIALKDCEASTHGAPYQLISGTAHLFGREHPYSPFFRREQFLLSQKYCGSERLKFIETGKYLDGRLPLADAIAISGAAVTPLMTDNPLLMALLFAANVRSGQWLPNPRGPLAFPQGSLGKLRAWLPVTPFRILLSLLGWNRSELRPYVFLGDGGTVDNLAVDALLKRRCRLIIAIDASQDADGTCREFASLLRRARDMGIRLTPRKTEAGQSLGIDRLLCPRPGERADTPGIPSTAPLCPNDVGHVAIYQIEYLGAGGETGQLIYLKATMTGDEPPQLIQFWRDNSEFPHDPPANQFFDPITFDAYRALGRHVGERFLEQHLESCSADLPAGVARPTAPQSGEEQRRQHTDLIESLVASAIAMAGGEEEFRTKKLKPESSASVPSAQAPDVEQKALIKAPAPAITPDPDKGVMINTDPTSDERNILANPEASASELCDAFRRLKQSPQAAVILIPVLLDYLNHADETVVQRALEVLREIGYYDFDRLWQLGLSVGCTERVRWETLKLIQHLIDRGCEITQPLVSQIICVGATNQNEDWRELAGKTLIDFGRTLKARQGDPGLIALCHAGRPKRLRSKSSPPEVQRGAV